MKNKKLYAVMKLLTEVEVIDTYGELHSKVRIDGVEGYIPVYDTKEEAERESDNGKYQIIPIKTNELK
jgi:hypothetical protein